MRRKCPSYKFTAVVSIPRSFSLSVQPSRAVPLLYAALGSIYFVYLSEKAYSIHMYRIHGPDRSITCFLGNATYFPLMLCVKVMARMKAARTMSRASNSDLKVEFTKDLFLFLTFPFISGTCLCLCLSWLWWWLFFVVLPVDTSSAWLYLRYSRI